MVLHLNLPITRVRCQWPNECFFLSIINFVTLDIHVPESVRHFLIESTHKGVQIKGCPDEPVFSSLAALVYQHSITRISLPTRLIIPSVDIETDESNSYLTRIYENGAACNVIYFVCQDIESLTGDVAITKVIDTLKQAKPNQIKSAMVHFKASNKGITLTDNSHKWVKVDTHIHTR